MPLNAGQVLQNHYRIVSLLAQGGMGAVYRVWNTRLNIPMALKEMLPQPGLASHSLTQLRHQFQQEAMVLARLKHPHLVDVTDFFEEGGNAYLVMNFIEGKSLAHRIEREGALPEHQVLTWTSQLLNALAYCHYQGVIHRDVKPQNIIIRPDGQTVLVDFGLVKLWDPRDPRTRTAIRAMGTPEYAPPEQYDAAAGHTDARSDIYSLGATLYHALTGQAPPTATMRIVDPAVLTPVRALSPKVSSHVAAAVTRALELQPAARFGSAQEMATALASEAPPQAPPEPVEPPRLAEDDVSTLQNWLGDPVRTVSIAVVTIWVGLLLIADNLGFLWRTGVWNLTFIGAGVVVLLQVLFRLLVPAYRRPVTGSIILGAILLGIGLGNLVSEICLWPGILIIIGVSYLLSVLLRRR
jgi:serine/threonine protein kinase